MSINATQAGRLAICASTVLFGCAGPALPQPVRFVAIDDQGKEIAAVTMVEPLPRHDTSFTFTGPDAAGRPATIVFPSTFEVAGAFQCHWSRLIVICRTDQQNPAPAETDEGRDVRRLDMDTVLVADRPGGSAGDFATFKDGRLVAFGVRDESGREPWRYDLRHSLP